MCSGGAVSGSPAAKNLIACGFPSSTTSKSSAVSPVIGAPCLSVTTSRKVDEIDLGTERLLGADRGGRGT